MATARKIAVGLLAFCLPVSIAASNLAWGAALGVFLLGVLLRPGWRRYRWTGLEWPWLAHAGVTLLAWVFSQDRVAGARHVMSEGLIVVFFLAAQAQEPEDVPRNLGLFLGALTVAALWGVLQYAAGLNWDSAARQLSGPAWTEALPAALARRLAAWNGRAVGFYNHPLTYAEVLLLAWPLLLAGALFTTGRQRRFWGAGALAVLGAVLASGSRGVWLSLAAAVALWALVKRQKRLMAVMALLLALGAAAAAASPFLRNRLLGLVHLRQDSNSLVRLGLWDRSLRLMAEHPLLGVGPGNVHIRPDELRWGGSRPDMDWTEVHHIFFQMGVERGVLGLAAYVALLIALGRMFWRASGAGWSSGLWVGFTGLVLAGLTESWSHDSEVVMCLLFLAGCASALSRAPSRGDRPSP